MIFEERINITRIDEGQLTYLNDTAMKGIHQACGIAYSKDGYVFFTLTIYGVFKYNIGN